ncbi:hypothetical protein AELI107455_14755 [Aequorivita lipolytica]
MYYTIWNLEFQGLVLSFLYLCNLHKQKKQNSYGKWIF